MADDNGNHKDAFGYDDRLGRPTPQEAAKATEAMETFKLLPIMAAELREWYHSDQWKPSVGIDRQSKEHNDFWTAEAKYLFETIIFHSDVKPRIQMLLNNAGTKIAATLKRTNAEVKADELVETAEDRLGDDWQNEMKNLYHISEYDMEQIEEIIRDSNLAMTPKQQLEKILTIIGRPVFD